MFMDRAYIEPLRVPKSQPKMPRDYIRDFTVFTFELKMLTEAKMGLYNKKLGDKARLKSAHFSIEVINTN